MKKKISVAIALVLGIMITSSLIATEAGISQAVYAQSIEAGQKTANRNEVNVSINGEAATKIVAYNIDGYNYFRVADICKVLGLKVFNYPTEMGEGVKIVSDEVFDGIIETAPTVTKLKVDIKDINVFYGGSGYSKAKCFNYNDRNYIKLADIVAAANKDNASNLEAVQISATQGTGQAITTRPTTVDLKTSFDEKTNTITITKTVADFQKMYFDLYTERQGKPPYEDKNEIVQKPAATAQPELTVAPEVGTIPAKILKDPTKPAYKDNIVGNGDSTHVNWDNYTEPYASGLVGECTWYAMGRFEETTGVVHPHLTGLYNLSVVEKDETLKLITDPNKIVARSIAVFGKVHVLFVEYVERDSNGNPTYIYFTEGNNGRDSIYRPDQDGKVKKLEFDKFINRQATYKGCITVK